MRLQVTNHETDLTVSLREFVERRLHFALGRFGRRIKAVSVRLSVQPDPMGGKATCCVIQVDARGPAPLIIREQHRHFQAAVTRAVERAERAVQRQLFLERTAGIGAADSSPHP